MSSIRVHLAAIKTAHLLAELSLDLRHPRMAMVVEGVTRAKSVPSESEGRIALAARIKAWRPDDQLARFRGQ